MRGQEGCVCDLAVARVVAWHGFGQQVCMTLASLFFNASHADSTGLHAIVQLFTSWAKNYSIIYEKNPPFLQLNSVSCYVHGPSLAFTPLYNCSRHGGKPATIFIQQFSHFCIITVEIQYYARYCFNHVHPPLSSLCMDSLPRRKRAQGVIYGKEQVPSEGPTRLLKTGGCYIFFLFTIYCLVLFGWW